MMAVRISPPPDYEETVNPWLVTKSVSNHEGQTGDTTDPVSAGFRIGDLFPFWTGLQAVYSKSGDRQPLSECQESDDNSVREIDTMNHDAPSVDRRTYLAMRGTITAGIAGCLDIETEMLTTRVTDQPGDIDDFESCMVTIGGMWLGPEGALVSDAEDEKSVDRKYYDYDESQKADLVELRDENTQLIDKRDLETGTYEFLQLDIEDIDATLEDGSDTNVEVPGKAPLTFNETFRIRKDTHTIFTADFTPIQRGQAGGYVLQPVPNGISINYEEE